MDVHLRFAMHRDVQLINKEKEKLDGLVIPGNILSHQAAATSVFVTSLVDTPHVIDPVTFIFQHSGAYLNDDGKLRASVRKLCDDYHPDLAEILDTLGHNGLAPDDLPDCDELCLNVRKVQLEKVATASSASGTSKYLKRYSRTSVTPPRAIIPPYFRFEDPRDQWYRFSLNCALATDGIVGTTVPVAPVILSTIDALTTGNVQRIVADYDAFDQVFIWIDNYVETEVTSETIGKIRQFVKAFDEKGIRVETLYGGYLMMLSGFDGLSGVSHGVLYTQHKSFEAAPSSGGVPERYYIPAFRGFRSLSQTDLIIHKHPELMCNCSVCSDTLNGNPDKIILYTDKPELLRRHFLTVRREEANKLSSSSPDKEVRELRRTFNSYHSSISALPNPDAYITRAKMSGLSYLNEWAEAFDKATV